MDLNKLFENIKGKSINNLDLDSLEDQNSVQLLQYGQLNCGKKIPLNKLFLAEIDYFNLISFFDLFKKVRFLIIWYNQDEIITDFEIINIEDDLDSFLKDYLFIKEKIAIGEAHLISEGDTCYLGASLINSKKVSQPNSEKLARPREFVLKRKYLKKLFENNCK